MVRLPSRQERQFRGTPPSATTDGKQIKAARSRVPFSGFVKKLDVVIPDDSPLKTDYYLRWFNDTPGRVAAAQRAGYDFVDKSEVSFNDGVVAINNDVGEKVSALAGSKENGQPLLAFLMKLPIAFRQEDMEAHERQLMEIEGTIKRGQVGANPREMTAHGEDTRYEPKGAPISIKRAGFQHQQEN